MTEKAILYNAEIFPDLIEIRIGPKEGTGCHIELPRGVFHLYLSSLDMASNAREIELFEKYAKKMPFDDSDYEDAINLTFTPVHRFTNPTISNPSISPAPNSSPYSDLLNEYGVKLMSDEEKYRFEIIEDRIPEIRANTWDCIIVDLLSAHWKDIIDCFDFESSFIRETEGTAKLQFDLGAYKFSDDAAEQNLSNALRTAFFFTLAGYIYGLRKTQYPCFEDYFDNEFYKRVSLLFSIWSNRKKPEDIRYIPLYDSFSNLSNENKADLIRILKSILDTDYIAFDDKETLKAQLIEGCNEIHTDPAAQALEQTLIKPAMNYIMLREKSKEAAQSAHRLFEQRYYKDCANRCFYAMTFALKSLLEDRGQLAGWKAGELKEAETHSLLENKLNTLVSSGDLASNFQTDFIYVKDARWGCDYSIMTFVKADAQSCIQKMDDFCSEIERLTTH